jgi:hypothetical protein
MFKRAFARFVAMSFLAQAMVQDFSQVYADYRRPGHAASLL